MNSWRAAKRGWRYGRRQYPPDTNNNNVFGILIVALLFVFIAAYC